MKKAEGKLLVWVVLLAVLLTGCAGKGTEEKESVKVVLWHYYNDLQKERLDELIEEYNQSAGAEAGVEVVAYSQGSVGELSDKTRMILNNSTNQVNDMDMFLAYRDSTIQILEENPDKILDYQKYLTQEELAYYNQSYLQEGYFGEQLYILPIAKSTELLLMNQDKLEEFHGAHPDWSIEKMQTWEGLLETAQLYYEWTDGMTETLYDGQAFIGIDVLANYFIAQNHALGSSIYEYREDSVHFELQEEVIGKLFDTLYIPYTKGYYGSYGKYRSDDLRQSLLAGYIGSSSSISYFPSEEVDENSSVSAIRLGIYPYPHFEDAVKTAIQQGAGVVTLAGDERREEACVHFLKWLTQERGVEFAASLSYMPVGKEQLSRQQIDGMEQQDNSKRGMEVGMKQCTSYQMVHGFDFQKGYETRQELEDYLEHYIKAGREEFIGYLEQGMSMEEAAEAMNYASKRAAFYEGIVAIFEEAG